MESVMAQPVEAGQRQAAGSGNEQPSLMTPIGVVEGEVLACLDREGAVTLRQLNQRLKWPAYLVMMAVGALIRAGLVRGMQQELGVVIKLRRPLGELR